MSKTQEDVHSHELEQFGRLILAENRSYSRNISRYLILALVLGTAAGVYASFYIGIPQMTPSKAGISIGTGLGGMAVLATLVVALQVAVRSPAGAANGRSPLPLDTGRRSRISRFLVCISSRTKSGSARIAKKERELQEERQNEAAIFARQRFLEMLALGFAIAAISLAVLMGIGSDAGPLGWAILLSGALGVAAFAVDAGTASDKMLTPILRSAGRELSLELYRDILRLVTTRLTWRGRICRWFLFFLVGPALTLGALGAIFIDRGIPISTYYLFFLGANELLWFFVVFQVGIIWRFERFAGRLLETALALILLVLFGLLVCLTWTVPLAHVVDGAVSSMTVGSLAAFLTLIVLSHVIPVAIVFCSAYGLSGTRVTGFVLDATIGRVRSKLHKLTAVAVTTSGTASRQGTGTRRTAIIVIIFLIIVAGFAVLFSVDTVIPTP